MAYSYFGTITVQYGKCGAANSSNFPVPFNITDVNLASVAQRLGVLWANIKRRYGGDKKADFLRTVDSQ